MLTCCTIIYYIEVCLDPGQHDPQHTKPKAWTIHIESPAIWGVPSRLLHMHNRIVCFTHRPIAANPLLLSSWCPSAFRMYTTFGHYMRMASAIVNAAWRMHRVTCYIL